MHTGQCICARGKQDWWNPCPQSNTMSTFPKLSSLSG